MRTCPDCRHCDPVAGPASLRGWPNPVRWFDQPCPYCAHRLKAHEPGVPRELTCLSDAVAPVEPAAVEH